MRATSITEQSARDAERPRAAAAPCPLCAGETRPHAALPRVWHQAPGTRPFQVRWCDACDFGHLAPRPTPEELQRYYGEAYFSRYAQGGDPLARRGALARAADRALASLAWRLDRGRPVDTDALVALTPAGGRVCDVGCGNGKRLEALQARGLEVLGVEVDAAARARAAQRGVRVVEGVAEALPPEVPRGAFDTVTLHHVLEHCLDPALAVRNAAALLAPRGTLVIEVPNHACLAARAAGPAWFHMDAGRHVGYFTAASLRGVVEAAGLRVRAVHHAHYREQALAQRLLEEQHVWDALYADGAVPPAERPPRGSRPRRWATLLRAALGAPEAKYESVAVVASRA